MGSVEARVTLPREVGRRLRVPAVRQVPSKGMLRSVRGASVGA